MVKRQARRTVNIPHSHVWKLLSDLEGPTKYHPMVNHVEITSSNRKGIGASRKIHYIDGSTVTEQVVQIGQWYIIFKPQPCHDKAHGNDFTVIYRVKKLRPEWTEIVLEANYTLGARPWQAIRTLLLIYSTERNLYRQFQRILEGIEFHLTTEKEVRKGDSIRHCTSRRSSRNTRRSNGGCPTAPLLFLSR